MRLKGAQFRFVATSVLGWIAVRVALVALGSGGTVAVGSGAIAGDAGDERHLSWSRAATSASFVPSRPRRISPPAAREAIRGSLALSTGGRAAAAPISIADAVEEPLPARNREASPPVRETTPFAPRSASARESRWNASAYLFVRPGSGDASLSPAGQLGGSQMAARIAYRLNDEGPVRTALTARLYAPLAGAGAEGAVGLDWHPAPRVPLRLAIERRIALDHAGRNAWSAYAAGGVYAERGALVLDAYAQAGVVGTRARDPFADGALRVGHKTALGKSALILGAGLWGAAQPGVRRLDAGPRAALIVPVATHTISATLEGRFRVAGQARPGSGAALTVGVDF